MYDLAADNIRTAGTTFLRRKSAAVLTADGLQRRYLKVVFNYVVARIGAGAEADDVTAEVFAAAFSSLHRCPPPSDIGDDPARAYLFGIARRKLADSHRRRQRRPEETLTDSVRASGSDSPERRALASEAVEHLQRILAEIPELQAEALLLKYVEGLSLAEIGIVLNKKQGAVAQLLHRARESARRQAYGYFDSEFAEKRLQNEF